MMLIPKSTEEAWELGKNLSLKQILAYWREYKRCLRVSQNKRLSFLEDFKCGLYDSEFSRKMLKRSFREQMLRETIEGHLRTDGHHSLTKDQIEMLLRQRRYYGTVSDSTDQQSL